MRAKIEAQPSAPEPEIIEGISYYEGHKYPRYVNIPPELIDATDEDGIKRATFLEFRVRNILRRQSHIVKRIVRNENYSKQDIIGHDLTITLREDSPRRVVHVQVKADRGEIIAYKHDIRDKYFAGRENSEELVGKWLTEHGIILLNGTDGKSEADILGSFYPQLALIQQKALRNQKPEASGQMMLFPRLKPIQIFPKAA